MFRIRSAVSALGVLAVTLTASAGSLSTVEGAKITFDAPGKMLEISIKGSATGLSVKEEGPNVVLTADITTVKTGNDTRDGHLRKRFHGKPVTLTIAKSALKLPAGNTTTGSVPGTLTANDLPEPVTVNYSASGKDGVYAVTGDFKFDMLKHVKSEEICYLKICAASKVKVDASFTIKEK